MKHGFLTQLENDCSKVMENKNLIRKMRNEFHRRGYLKFPKGSVFSSEVLNAMREEAYELLGEYKVRRDIRIATTDNTPRKMSNVNAKDIRHHNGVIDYAYKSEGLKKFLGEIAGDSLTDCWEDEWYIINFQHEKGDTHGWHWGDYPYTLIWVIEAPSVEHGGILQCIPHTVWDKKNPQVNKHIVEGTIESMHHESGDCYLLKSDTTLHRASPVNASPGIERIIVNTCWASVEDKRGEGEIDRSSMTEAFV